MIRIFSLLFSVFVLFPNALALTDLDRQEFAAQNALAPYNSGFESGKASWVASPALGLSTSTQLVPNSKQYATWDSTSAGQTVCSTAVTVPKTGNCEGTLWVATPSGTATHLLVANDGTNDLISTTILSSVAATKQSTGIFACPSSGTVKMCLRSVASNEPSVSIDNARLGESTRVGSTQITTPTTVAPAPTIGGVTTPPTKGTNSTDLMTWRRNGDRLELSYQYRQTASGSAGNGLYKFPIPSASGCVIDTTKTAASAGVENNLPGVGALSIQNNAEGGGVGTVQVYDSSNLWLYAMTPTAAYNVGSTNYSYAASSFQFSFQASVPCVGWVSQNTVDSNQQRTPTVTRLTSGSGTYTTPAGATFLRVSVVGGGGGGGGAGSSAPGATGGTSTFGGSLLSATGGNGGAYYNNGGAGGLATINSPAIEVFKGAGNSGGGGGGGGGQQYTGEGNGGGSPFLGGGGHGSAGAAVANTGGGGGGAGSGTFAAGSGAGGGAGLIALINSPAATYSYSVGGGGAGGVGTNGTGGAGGSGVIIIEEHYGYTTALIANSVSSPLVNGSAVAYGTVDNGSATTNCTTSTCSLRNSSGATSATRLSNGSYRVNITPGTFSTFPSCSCSAISFGVGPTVCIAYMVTANQLLIDTQNPPDKAFYDSGFTFTCMGPR